MSAPVYGRPAEDRCSRGSAVQLHAFDMLLVSEQLGVPDDEAGRLVAAWLRAGLLVEASSRHPTRRKQRLGLRVNAAKRANAQKPRTPEA